MIKEYTKYRTTGKLTDAEWKAVHARMQHWARVGVNRAYALHKCVDNDREMMTEEIAAQLIGKFIRQKLDGDSENILAVVSYRLTISYLRTIKSVRGLQVSDERKPETPDTHQNDMVMLDAIRSEMGSFRFPGSEIVRESVLIGLIGSGSPPDRRMFAGMVPARRLPTVYNAALVDCNAALQAVMESTHG